jgi:peroxiredoxin
VIEVGERAPDFRLPSAGGREVHLEEETASHRATVIAFYVLDFTPG